MPLAERSLGDVVVVSVTGDLTATTGMGIQLRDTVRTLLQQGHRHLLLDLAATQHLDSTGLGELVHAFASTRNRGGALGLLHPTRRIKELLRITKLESVFECHDSEEDALAAFPPKVP
jgi:anti-sigma B factor antagonist